MISAAAEQLIVARPPSISWSLPLPPVSESFPLPPMMVSAPHPADYRSFPDPAMTRSSPEEPDKSIVSLLIPVAMITSAAPGHGQVGVLTDDDVKIRISAGIN